MKIIIKVSASEKQEGKDYDALMNQFEVVVNGDTQDFLDVVNKIITIIPSAQKKLEGVINEAV